MNVSLLLSTDQDAHIIRNLWPLYQHDVSEFDKAKPNKHGLFGVDDRVMTLTQQSESMDAWWKEPGTLFPYLVLADGEPAGFCLIAARPRIPTTIPADFIMHEFFILHAYRGKRVGEHGAIHSFDSHRGKWEVVTYPNHPRSISFWRRVINRYSMARFSENEMDHPWGRKVVFRFSNTDDSGRTHFGEHE